MTQAITGGGIGLFQTLARRVGLIRTIDNRLRLFKLHMADHESDHVLNIAYNACCRGTCLQDIELRRNDEVFLNALGTRRIPDPTTAADFCRRFTKESIETLIDAINETRMRVWAFVLLPCQILKTGRRLVYPAVELEWPSPDLLPVGEQTPLLSVRTNEVGIWMSRSAVTPRAIEQNGER